MRWKTRRRINTVKWAMAGVADWARWYGWMTRTVVSRIWLARARLAAACVFAVAVLPLVLLDRHRMGPRLMQFLEQERERCLERIGAAAAALEAVVQEIETIEEAERQREREEVRVVSAMRALTRHTTLPEPVFAPKDKDGDVIETFLRHPCPHCGALTHRWLIGARRYSPTDWVCAWCVNPVPPPPGVGVWAVRRCRVAFGRSSGETDVPEPLFPQRKRRDRAVILDGDGTGAERP